jgi:hypothetical protein
MPLRPRTQIVAAPLAVEGQVGTIEEERKSHEIDYPELQ